MTKKIYLENFEKCAGPLCFTLLIHICDFLDTWKFTEIILRSTADLPSPSVSGSLLKYIVVHAQLGTQFWLAIWPITSNYATLRVITGSNFVPFRSCFTHFSIDKLPSFQQSISNKISDLKSFNFWDFCEVLNLRILIGWQYATFLSQWFLR